MFYNISENFYGIPLFQKITEANNLVINKKVKLIFIFCRKMKIWVLMNPLMQVSERQKSRTTDSRECIYGIQLKKIRLDLKLIFLGRQPPLPILLQSRHICQFPSLAQTILQKYSLVLTVMASLLGILTHLAIPHFKKSLVNCNLAYRKYNKMNQC